MASGTAARIMRVGPFGPRLGSMRDGIDAHALAIALLSFLFFARGCVRRSLLPQVKRKDNKTTLAKLV